MLINFVQMTLFAANMSSHVRCCCRWQSWTAYLEVSFLELSVAHLLELIAGGSGLTVVNGLGLNLTVGSCVYHDSHGDVQSWSHGAQCTACLQCIN